MNINNGTIVAANRKSGTNWNLVSGKELEPRATGTAKLRQISKHRYIDKSILRLDIPSMMTGRVMDPLTYHGKFGPSD